MIEEKWIVIKGFDGKYSISNWGGVRNNKTGKPKAQRLRGKGYWAFDCYDFGKRKTFYTHVLVGKYFLPDEEGRSLINHIDGVKTNSHISNLEKSNYVENAFHKFHIIKTGRLISKFKIDKLYQSKAFKSSEDFYNELMNSF